MALMGSKFPSLKNAHGNIIFYFSSHTFMSKSMPNFEKPNSAYFLRPSTARLWTVEALVAWLQEEATVRGYRSLEKGSCRRHPCYPGNFCLVFLFCNWKGVGIGWAGGSLSPPVKGSLSPPGSLSPLRGHFRPH